MKEITKRDIARIIQGRVSRLSKLYNVEIPSMYLLRALYEIDGICFPIHNGLLSIKKETN